MSYSTRPSHFYILCGFLASTSGTSCSSSSISGDASVESETTLEDDVDISCIAPHIAALGATVQVVIHVRAGTLAESSITPIESPLEVHPTIINVGISTFDIIFSHTGVYKLEVLGIGGNGSTDTCEIEINVIDPGEEIVALCPDSVATTIPTRISLEAEAVGGTAPLSPSWVLSEYPPDLPAEDVLELSAEDWNIEYDLVIQGYYSFYFTVRDSRGLESSCATSITSEETTNMFIKLIWNPPDNSCEDVSELPDCDPTDVDIHLANLERATAWFNNFDCYYETCIGNREMLRYLWNDEAPQLYRDDRMGHGPEVIEVGIPSSGHDYAIGVHRYMNTISPFEPFPVIASVTVACRGEDRFESGPILINDDNDFVVVATLNWNDGDCIIEPTVDEYGDYISMTRHQASMRLW